MKIIKFWIKISSNQKNYSQIYKNNKNEIKLIEIDILIKLIREILLMKKKNKILHEMISYYFKNKNKETFILNSIILINSIFKLKNKNWFIKLIYFNLIEDQNENVEYFIKIYNQIHLKLNKKELINKLNNLVDKKFIYNILKIIDIYYLKLNYNELIIIIVENIMKLNEKYNQKINLNKNNIKILINDFFQDFNNINTDILNLLKIKLYEKIIENNNFNWFDYEDIIIKELENMKFIENIIK